MPRDAKPLYQRGRFWLGWDRRSDGSLRSPNLAIFWYDADRRRERSATTGTADVDAAKLRLDAHYLQHDQGAAVCPTCGQPRNGGTRFLVADAIANYMLEHAGEKASLSAIRARLAHVVAYLATLPLPVAVEDVDEPWIGRFRQWAHKQPVARPGGEERARSAGTIEASVRQLSAAINHAHSRHNTLRPAAFKALAPREVSRTPDHRSDVPELARMFSYVLDRSRRKRSAPLHRFLILSVATAARPDAALDLSTAPAKRQWNSARRVLNLNPADRRQTTKVRATVKAPWQLAAWLDADAEMAPGPFVPVVSVKHAWASMAKKLGLPNEGQAGMKLVRRSVGQILRDRAVPENEIELQLGHRRLKGTTDLYAAFKPEHLANATRTIEALIDEIEALAPGAFYRGRTGEQPNVVPMKGTKIA